MKRKNNLYPDLYKLENIEQAFKEVCQNTQNKRKVAFFKEYKCIYISRIYKMLEQRNYAVGPYNIFYIYEPKKRRIVSQELIDKIVNHLVSRHILYPSILPCLIDANVASRKDLGSKKGIELAKNFYRKSIIKYKTLCFCFTLQKHIYNIA